jgi:hypothetical protein
MTQTLYAHMNKRIKKIHHSTKDNDHSIPPAMIIWKSILPIMAKSSIQIYEQSFLIIPLLAMPNPQFLVQTTGK